MADEGRAGGAGKQAEGPSKEGAGELTSDEKPEAEG
jgi:uncharacterized protein YjbJ (UPF0337 family)